MGLLRRPFPWGLALLLGSVLTAGAEAQSVLIRPSAFVPLGDSRQWFSEGVGVEAGPSLPLAGLPLKLAATLGTTWVPLNGSGSLLDFSLGAEAEGGLSLGSVWSINGRLRAGGAWVNRASFQQSALSPTLEAGLGFRAQVEPALGYGFGLDWRWVPGLYQALAVWVTFDQGWEGR